MFLNKQDLVISVFNIKRAVRKKKREMKIKKRHLR